VSTITLSAATNFAQKFKVKYKQDLVTSRGHHNVYSLKFYQFLIGSFSVNAQTDRYAAINNIHVLRLGKPLSVVTSPKHSPFYIADQRKMEINKLKTIISGCSGKS